MRMWRQNTVTRWPKFAKKQGEAQWELRFARERKFRFTHRTKPVTFHTVDIRIYIVWQKDLRRTDSAPAGLARRHRYRSRGFSHHRLVGALDSDHSSAAPFAADEIQYGALLYFFAAPH